VGIFRLLARVTIGVLFVGHGTQKLFGWFGGGGPEGTAQGFESMGLRPGKRNAILAGIAETTGGLLFALGAATPAAAAALTSVMATAIKTVHWEKGVWSSQGGYEYNLVLLVTVFGLTENGPGPWSVDGLGQRVGPRRAACRSGRLRRSAFGSLAGRAGSRAAAGSRNGLVTTLVA
jgi:putative oxidoreductase